MHPCAAGSTCRCVRPSKISLGRQGTFLEASLRFGCILWKSEVLKLYCLTKGAPKHLSFWSFQESERWKVTCAKRNALRCVPREAWGRQTRLNSRGAEGVQDLISKWCNCALENRTCGKNVLCCF